MQETADLCQENLYLYDKEMSENKKPEKITITI